MAVLVTLTHTFGGLSSPIPLSYLDADYTDITSALASLNSFSNYYADTGGVNAYAFSLPAGITATLSAGLRVQFKAANANTGASTLNVGSTGAKNILTISGLALTSGMIPAGAIVDVMYDGTQYLFLNASPALAKVTNSLGGNVALNNTGAYFDGPSCAQGTVGTWWASGTVTLIDTAGSSNFDVKLWDGTTVIASTRVGSFAINAYVTVSLSGYLATPAGNIRISVKDVTSTSGSIIFNVTGNSKDSTLSVYRIA